MFAPRTSWIINSSQLRNFAAQDFPPLPHLMKETLYFSFSRTKLAKILADPKWEGVGGSKVPAYQAQRQLQHRLVGTRLVPGGSSGCSRSSSVQLRRKHCVSNSLCLTKPVLEPFVLTVMSSEEVFFSSLRRSTIGWGAGDQSRTKAATAVWWHAGSNEAAAPSLSLGSAARLQWRQHSATFAAVAAQLGKP